MKIQSFTIKAALTLAIAVNLSFADDVKPLDKTFVGTNYKVSPSEWFAEPVLTKLDYSQTFESFDYEGMYPYVLMSYLAEMYKVSSRNESKQQALSSRFSILEEAGFHRVSDSSGLSAFSKSLFINENAPEKITAKAGLMGGFYDKNTQFKGRLFINDEQKKVVLAIAGTDFSSPASMGSAWNLSAGKRTGAAILARKLATDLQNTYKGYTIELTGASQGGAIAQYAAVEPSINGKAFVFNSLAIGSDITSQWSKEQLSRISHAYVEGEMLNGDDFNFAGAVFQSKMPVEGVVIPVYGVVEEQITNVYYNSYNWDSYNKLISWTPYLLTSRSIMLHWTGALLEAVEYHAGHGDTLPPLH